jgi:hypothetical protein
MHVDDASVEADSAPNLISTTTAIPSTPSANLNTVTPAAGAPVVTQQSPLTQLTEQQYDTPAAAASALPSVQPFTSPDIPSPTCLTMADIKRRLDNTHTHASTEQLLAGRVKRARKTGIALDDPSVLSFVRAPLVAAIVDDSAIVPSSLVDNIEDHRAGPLDIR